MKKNKFQQQQQLQSQQQPNKNYFDEDEEVDIEQDPLFDQEALKACKPFEEYFEKFNQLYNQFIDNYQKFEDDHQIPLTQPDYESLIQVHFLVYEKNVGMFDFIKTDNKFFDKLCASFIFIDNEIRMLEENFYQKHLDKMTIYGELSDLHHIEDQQLKDGEAEIMISRTLGMFKQIYDIIKKIINYVTHLINQLNILYNKKDPIYKNSFKNFNLYFPLDTIGRALSMIYVLDCVVEQNDYLQQHWNFYKRMIKIIKSDCTKYNMTEPNFKTLEKILIRLDKTVISGTCLQGVLQQNWDINYNQNSAQAKNSAIPAIKNNKELYNYILGYLNSKQDMLEKTVGTQKEISEREQVLTMLCVYAFFRRLYPSEEDKKLWKQLWTLQKRIPMVEGHSQVFCYVSKFLMEVTPLSKSTSMDPKDPIAFFRAYLQKLNQVFSQQILVLYTQFTTWLVRMDSFVTSQMSFLNIEKIPKDKAQTIVEDRFTQRINLLLNGLVIASQIRNLLQSLLIGTLGMEDQTLDKDVIKDVVLAIQMLKAIEYQMREKFDAFQPAYLNKQIIRNAFKITQPVLDKIKKDPKGFGSGASEVIAALQLVNQILRSPISPPKLLTLQYCVDFLCCTKDVFNATDKEEFKFTIFKLEKITLLPLYVRKVTASTYFYWCRDLLPLFFQTIYRSPRSAKRFQFLLNAVSDCSRQLKGCLHLTLPDELYESFRKFVVQVFYQEYLNPLSRDIEDFLRLHIHAVLIEKITEVNPFRTDVKDIKRLLDVDQVQVFDSVVNLRTEINLYLNETFYNINVLNMYDMETYEQMRSLANFKFGLQLMNVYLPSQTIDQGSFDVLNIIKNIQGFVTKYAYNMYTQTFVQIPGESKQLFTVGISQISDSIRTHGIGMVNTNINAVYLYLKKKIQVFSEFLFDELIQQPLNRENRWFKESKDQIDGIYPFERAEALSKEIKKLGVFEDGKTFLDKFRILITQVGNALGIVRLIRSATLNFCSKSIEFLSSGYSQEQSFAEHSTQAGFSQTSTNAGIELDEIFRALKTNFSDSTDYIKMLVKVFSQINSPENKHLRLFYLIIPSLSINYVENMMISKERLQKKNAVDCMISDDGFIIGVQYFLNLLDQKTLFDSLHWRKEIRQRFQKEIEGAKNLTKSTTATSQRVAEEINMQKELSLRKLNMQTDEYQMFFYAFNASKILFIDK